MGVTPISPEPKTDLYQHSPESSNSSDVVTSSSEEKEKRRKDRTKSTTPVLAVMSKVPVTKVIFSLLPSNCCITMFLFGREMDQHRKLA